MMSAEDEMRQLVDALGLTEPTDAHSPSDLTDQELVKQLNEVTETLLNRGEAIKDHSEAARELHSQRSALLWEMHKRGLR